jgi:hypothetical protein
LDGDGKKEIIAGIAGITAHTIEGGELWHAPSSGLAQDIVVGDVNSDKIPEIVVASDELEVFSADGQKLFSYGEAGKFSSVALGDVDDDGVLEIVAGGTGVYVFKMTYRRCNTSGCNCGDTEFCPATTCECVSGYPGG